MASKHEDESSSGEDEADSSDDEPENRPTNSPIPNPQFDPKSASGGSELDSDADSKRIPSRSASKRSRDEIDVDLLRRCKSSRIGVKKSVSTLAGGGGLGCINRLWSNEDEIALLNAMIEFKIAKGFDPNADMVAFHGFIQGKLKVNFSRVQLRTKFTRMKKRFLIALKKGSDAVFSTPHEDMTFELSKIIWGKSDNERGGVDFWAKYPNTNVSFDNVKTNFPSLVAPVAGMSLLRERLSLIGDVKAKELDDKWKQLFVEESRLSHKALVLMKEQVQMALDQ